MTPNPSDDAATTFDARAAMARLEADHVEIAHKTVVTATLDWLAVLIVEGEPYLGPAEAWVAGVAGAFVAGTALGAPLAPLASTLTLVVEKAAVGELRSWAVERLAEESDS